jgi:hypothetical protein
MDFSCVRFFRGEGGGEGGSVDAALSPPLSLFTSLREREGGKGFWKSLGHTGHTSRTPLPDTGAR